MRDVVTVTIEAIVIGLMNVILIKLLSNLKSFESKSWMVYMLSGAAIHVLFEIFGGNEYWCRTTYK